jgi:hypothetical protein
LNTSNGIQLWKVPTTGSYTIRAVGAYSGNSGRGRDITTTTTLTKDEVIKILVGQQGTYIQGPDGNFRGGGGGGGTFVVRDTQTPIIVAGGGGGRGENQNPANSGLSIADASESNNGKNGGSGYNGTAQGGTNGSGGQAIIGGYSSGGGGLIGDGGSMIYVNGGKSFINGGAGGSPSSDVNYVGIGGFGGGGSVGAGGGGGGGYSGGGGGDQSGWFEPGGGGGSYTISTMIDNGAINYGHGSVTITLN